MIAKTIVQWVKIAEDMNFKLSMCYSWTTVLVLNNVGPIIQSERHTIYKCIDLKNV